MAGWQLISFLIVAGGIIAYLGDRIGQKVGRRRLSLFGLRPKYSSIIITVVTGILISTASISLLMAASRDVRHALFSMKTIQDELKRNRETMQESLRQLQSLEEVVAEQKVSLAAIERARLEAVRQRDHAQKQNDELQAEYERAGAELEKLQADLEDWKKRVAELRELSTELEDSVARMQRTEEGLRREIAQLTEEYLHLEGQMRTGSFIFQKDEIVAAAVIEGGRAQERIEEDLLALLEEADKKAYSRGARIEGKERALALSEDAYFFDAVNVLKQGKGLWVVRAGAARNTVAGEPVMVYLHLFKNERIYRQGDVILSTVIDGGRSDSEKELLQLLHLVNKTVIDKGMITVDGEVGEVDGGQFIDALLQLQRLGGPAQVAAIAARDTYLAQGPLLLRLEVTPAAG